jgi:hypothetical protein
MAQKFDDNGEAEDRKGDSAEVTANQYGTPINQAPSLSNKAHKVITRIHKTQISLTDKSFWTKWQLL